MSGSGMTGGLLCWNCGRQESLDAVVCSGCGTAFAPLPPNFEHAGASPVGEPLTGESDFSELTAARSSLPPLADEQPVSALDPQSILEDEPALEPFSEEPPATARSIIATMVEPGEPVPPHGHDVTTPPTAYGATPPVPPAASFPVATAVELLDPVTGLALAPWWRRAVAILIDSAIVGTASWIATFVLIAAAPKGTDSLGFQSYTLGTIVFVGIGYLAILFAGGCYVAKLNGSQRGQTLGKRVMGIAVRDASTGGPIGTSRGAGRYAITLVFALPFGILSLIDGLMPLWDGRRQSLHDKTVHSIVVMVNGSAAQQTVMSGEVQVWTSVPHPGASSPAGGSGGGAPLAQRSAGPDPSSPEAFAAAGLASVTGLMLVISAIFDFHRYLTFALRGGYLGAQAALWLALDGVVAVAGVALLLSGRALLGGSRRAWMVAVLLGAPVFVAELLASGRNLGGLLALVFDLAMVGVLLLPRARYITPDEVMAAARDEVANFAEALAVAFVVLGGGLIGLALGSTVDAVCGCLLLLAAATIAWDRHGPDRAALRGYVSITAALFVGGIAALVAAHAQAGALLAAPLALMCGSLLATTELEFGRAAVATATAAGDVAGQSTAVRPNLFPAGMGVALLAAAALAISGIGTSRADFAPVSAPAPATLPPATVPAAITTTSTIPPSSATFTNSWTWSGVASGGYTEDVKLQVGTPEQFTQGLTNGSVTAGSACNLDDTDAVIPFTLSVTNSSSGSFTEYVAAEIEGVGSNSMPSAPNSELDAEVGFSSGAQCFSSSSDSQLIGGSTEAVAPGAGVNLTGFFVVTNYYSPNSPQGDTVLLADTDLQIPTQVNYNPSDGSAGVSYVTTAVDGPGVSPLSGVGLQFSLLAAAATTVVPSTTVPNGKADANAINAVLSESAKDRDTLRSAVASAEACNDLPADASSLQEVVTDRQTLLQRVQGFNLVHLPRHESVLADLEQALTASVSSDQSYEAWVGDLANNGCDPSSVANDSNFQSAQQSDATAEAAKGAFAAAWNPDAKRYSLPPQTANSF